MLLPQEAQLRDDLARSFSSRGESAPQIGVLLLDRREALVGEKVARAVCGFERLEPTFG